MPAKEQMKILLVEDENALLDALTEKFTHEGFEVLRAHNGEEGLATAQEDIPDIIILDILMPKMDGLTMLKKLRHESSWARTVPVIILTNVNDPEQIANATANFPQAYLVKIDWKIEDVVKMVKEKLGIE